MADQRLQYTERCVGANSPLYPDTLNRLALVAHNIDGTHTLSVFGTGTTDSTTFLRGDGVWTVPTSGLLTSLGGIPDGTIVAFNGTTGSLIEACDAGMLGIAGRLTSIGGTSDAIVAATSPTISAYTAGLRVVFTPLSANTTTTPSLNINSLGAITIMKLSPNGKVALLAGDFNQSFSIDLEYDGTNFVLLNPLPLLNTASNIQKQTYTAYTTTGTSSAFILTPTNPITSYTNAKFFITFHTAPSPQATLNISGLGAVGMFAYGENGNLENVNSYIIPTGWSSDVCFDGTRFIVVYHLPYLTNTSYIGTQKAIFGYGYTGGYVNMTNLVSNTGVVATDTTGVGTARYYLAAAGYGVDKAIFGYGYTGSYVNMTNLVSNTGVVATDTTGVGTARSQLAAAGYGVDKAIFGYGYTGSYVNMTNLVSNAGVVATDTTGVGTARYYPAAAGYGVDKAIFGYGIAVSYVNMTNLVSNTGVVATDTTGVGTARYYLAAAGYGVDKAIFGYGYTGSYVNMTNLVSNAGVVATDTTGVGTARYGLAASGFSLT